MGPIDMVGKCDVVMMGSDSEAMIVIEIKQSWCLQGCQRKGDCKSIKRMPNAVRTILPKVMTPMVRGSNDIGNE